VGGGAKGGGALKSRPDHLSQKHRERDDTLLFKEEGEFKTPAHARAIEKRMNLPRKVKAYMTAGARKGRHMPFFPKNTPEHVLCSEGEKREKDVLEG